MEVFGKPGDIPEDTPQHELSLSTASGSSVRVPGRHSGVAGAEGKVEMMILNHDDADVPETIMVNPIPPPPGCFVPCVGRDSCPYPLS